MIKALQPIVDSVTVSPLQSNCYIVACPQILEGLIIDPGDEPSRIMAVVDFHKITVKAIVATHGHVDHVLAVKGIKDVTNAPFFISEGELELARNAHEYAKLLGWFAYPIPEPDGFLKGGDTLAIGKLVFQVLSLPGHSPDHIGLYLPNEPGILFCGDVLFAGGVGRTDLPGGDWEVLQTSLKRLIVLPDDTIVYPGHGPKTSIGNEKWFNPFIPNDWR